MKPFILFTPRELKLMALAALVFSGLLFANLVFSAWDNPPSNPPLGNVPAPLNVGPDTQLKHGHLILESNSLVAENVSVDRGRFHVQSEEPSVFYADARSGRGPGDPVDRTWRTFVNYSPGNSWNEFVIDDTQDTAREFLLSEDGRLNLLEGLVTNYDGTDGIAIGACPHGDCSYPFENLNLAPTQNLRVSFGATERMFLSNAGHLTIDGTMNVGTNVNAVNMRASRNIVAEEKLAADEKVMSDQYCNRSGSQCFTPAEVSSGSCEITTVSRCGSTPSCPAGWEQQLQGVTLQGLSCPGENNYFLKICTRNC